MTMRRRNNDDFRMVDVGGSDSRPVLDGTQVKSTLGASNYHSRTEQFVEE
jgi:hypothetical protein